MVEAFFINMIFMSQFMFKDVLQEKFIHFISLDILTIRL